MIAPEPSRTRWAVLWACDAQPGTSSVRSERGEASGAIWRNGRERVGDERVRASRASVWVLRPPREANPLTGKPSAPN